MKRFLISLVFLGVLLGATSPPVTVPITITASGGSTINATTYCAANGGGDGSSATPWQDQCIVAAVNAASNGDTVFLAAGNWALNTSVATFTGAISGSTLTVSGVTGTIAIGQSVGGVGVINTATGINYYLPLVIIGGSGSTWTLNSAVSTGVSGPMTTGYPVVIQKAVNLVGAGSGNTFDVYGHPKNGFTASASAFYATITPAGSITRVYMTGPYYLNKEGAGGFVLFNGHATGATGQRISNIFIDGALGYDGFSELALIYCNSCVVDNIRLWAHDEAAGAGETQYYIGSSSNFTTKNSVFAEPPLNFVSGVYYPQGEGFQTAFLPTHLITNNLFYQLVANPIDDDYTTFIGNSQYNISDSLGLSQFNAAIGMPGCPYAGGCPTNGGSTGNYGFYVRNNYFDATGFLFGAGGGVNDPSGGGQSNDIALTGNWVFANKGSLSSCYGHVFSYCTTGLYTNVSGMQINCAASPCNDQLAITNNSIIASGSGNAAVLDATGTGVAWSFSGVGASFTGTIASGTTLTVSGVSGPGVAIGQYIGGAGITANTQITGGGGSTWTISPSQSNVGPESMISGHNNTVYGFNATQNYLSSASNQYLTDVNSISPVQSNNYCTGSSFAGCNTSGFTTPPTCSFTLGTLSGSTVPFNSTSFTAQYGAVQWLASTSSTTPTSADSRWNNDNDHGIGDVSGGNSYMPPVSLASVSHGNTVYVWVMDSVNQISSCGSVAVP